MFNKQRCLAIEALSAESGIGILDVIDDMAAEGLTVLREDVYNSIIKFRKRKGEVIHERVDRRVDTDAGNGQPREDLKETQQSEDSGDAEVASIFLQAVAARERPIPAPPLNADERPGQPREDIDNPRPLIGDEMVEPHFGEPEPDLPL